MSCASPRNSPDHFCFANENKNKIDSLIKLQFFSPLSWDLWIFGCKSTKFSTHTQYADVSWKGTGLLHWGLNAKQTESEATIYANSVSKVSVGYVSTAKMNKRKRKAEANHADTRDWGLNGRQFKSLRVRKVRTSSSVAIRLYKFIIALRKPVPYIHSGQGIIRVSNL